MRNCCRLLILIALLLLPASLGLAQSNAAAQIIWQGAPTVTNQQVELRFSLSDQQGFSPAELPPTSIKLSEPSTNLKLTTSAELSMTLAIIVTLGLFFPWARIRLARYRAEHLALAVSGSLDDFVAQENERVSATGDETADMFALDVAL